jgi:DmsE family decaheme c-type cytochrome
MVRIKLLTGLLCSLAVAWGVTAADAKEVAQATAPTPAAFAPRAEQSCIRCHDKAPVTDILRTPHEMKGDPMSPGGQHGCESCHGASEAHMATPPAGQKRALPAIVFRGPNASPPEARNEVCLSCHQYGARMNWTASEHVKNDTGCATCHTAHAVKDPVLVKTSQPQVCFTCHAEQRADSFKFSHHPIREGKVVCSDCHNPHGSIGPKQLKEVSVNETCYNCHADKRGPLLWEHAPVRENCDNCHTPHGSVENRLLKVRAPWLCQECHDASRHPGTPFSGANLANSTIAGAVSAKMQLLVRGCTNCHSQVHGTNSPSGAMRVR